MRARLLSRFEFTGCRILTWAALLWSALAAPCAAHLALVSPPSRYGGNVLKLAPCGRDGGSRGSLITIAEPGSELAVTWDEYVDHPGHYRIAFDADGDDDFRDPPCTAGCNGRTPTIGLYSDPSVLLDGIADTIGGRSTVRVTLPDIECERCTLQVIQVMYDKPPYEIGGNDIYYQCVDLVLRRSAPLPTATVTAIPTDRLPTATATPLPSATLSATPSATVTSEPTPTFTPACRGDCDGDARVDVSEILTLVAVALGERHLADCTAADGDGSGEVDVGELVAALQRVLHGCFSQRNRP